MKLTAIKNRDWKSPTLSKYLDISGLYNVSCQKEKLRLLQEKDQCHVKIATKPSTAAD